MKRIAMAAMLIFGVAAASAQDAEAEAPKYGWEKNVVGTLNFTQTQLSNWAQGGEDSWTGQLDINGKFNNVQERFDWSNSGKISYGKTKSGGADAIKSVDEISLESVYTRRTGFVVNPYVAVTALTQLDEGFNYDVNPDSAISKFLNPGYFTQSVGIGRTLAKGLKTRAGLAFKQTIVTDEQFAPAYSDDLETAELEKARTEVGLESVSELSRKVMENILFTSKLELFSNLQGQDAIVDTAGFTIQQELSLLERVDVRWDNVLSAQVNKYVTVSFNVQLFYDSDISRKRQLKQVLAAGLTYTFL